MNSGLNPTELSAFAHDVRSHLRAIIIGSQLQMRRPGVDPATAAALQKTVDEAKQLDALVSATVNYGCLAEASDAPLRLMKLSSIVQALRLELRAAGLHLFEAEPLQVAAGLQWVLRELITNSLKFAGPDCVIHVTCEKQGAMLAICVHDNGPGVKAQHQGEAMRPFKRLQGKGEFPGHGLGLPTAARLAAVCGGSLHFEKPENGCAVTVLWPYSD